MKTQDLADLDADQINQFRMQNQWKLNMKSHLGDIMRDLTAMDDKKQMQVDPREFMRVLETRLRSSEPQKQYKE